VRGGEAVEESGETVESPEEDDDDEVWVGRWVAADGGRGAAGGGRETGRRGDAEAAAAAAGLLPEELVPRELCQAEPGSVESAGGDPKPTAEVVSSLPASWPVGAPPPPPPPSPSSSSSSSSSVGAADGSSGGRSTPRGSGTP